AARYHNLADLASPSRISALSRLRQTVGSDCPVPPTLVRPRVRRNSHGRGSPTSRATGLRSSRAIPPEATRLTNPVGRCPMYRFAVSAAAGALCFLLLSGGNSSGQKDKKDQKDQKDKKAKDKDKVIVKFSAYHEHVKKATFAEYKKKKGFKSR